MCKVWELKAGSPAGTIVCRMCRQFREWFINIKFITLQSGIKAQKEAEKSRLYFYYNRPFSRLRWFLWV